MPDQNNMPNINSEIIEEIENILKNNLPTINISNIKEEVKYGLIEKFLFDKIKPDKNNFYPNLTLIKYKNSSFREVINYVSENKHLEKNYYLIMFKELENKWNFLVLKKFKTMNTQDLEKYLILL